MFEQGTASDRSQRHYVRDGHQGGAANAEVRGIQVFGCVAFNWSTGGVNPAAVEEMVNMRGAGAEKVGSVVWMPSNDSRNHFVVGPDDYQEMGRARGVAGL
ncbi:MAG TPA: DUF6282 family protein [Vicinamibacterales bacterium]|nr:DUF6282 family protein [Vicinamibacterales bacterium]